MPAPAVYIIAVVGTVGAVLAFKEFVYEPHIAPAIGRWKLEFQAARRRRTEAAMHRAESELLMSQTDHRSPSSRRDEDDSDGDRPFGDHGNGGNASNNRFMRNGLLLRRPERDAQQMQNQQDVELENLVSSEVSEWRNEVSSQVLRQRKNNVSEDAMNESIQEIPYSPLSPSRTHVLFDPSSPSTPSSGSRPTSPPSPQSPPVFLPHPLSYSMTTGAINAGRSALSSPVPQDSHVQIQKSSSPSPRSPAFSPQLSHPSPPQPSTLQQMVAQSTLFGSGPETTPTVNIPSTARDSASPSSLLSHPLQQSYTQSIPSLSQSYPQDLDYEHGLELLSPPSSRSISPFSIAGMSPNQGAPNAQGLRTLSPFGSVSSVNSMSRSASNFSSTVSSPSPLRMGLGNESFDTVSPVTQQRLLGQAVSPRLEPLSTTNSARSTTYLSFSDDSSDDGDMASQTQHANLGASGLEGTFGNVSPQPVPLYSSAQSFASISNSLLVNNSQADRTIPTGQTPTQESLLAFQPQAQAADSLGLTLFPISPREPRTPPTYTANMNPFADPIAYAAQSYIRTPSTSSNAGDHLRGHAPAQSDGELSDLDLMSDYAPSESDLGNESDSSWSMAGGSNAGGSNAGGSNTASPRLGPGANAAPAHRDTIRAARGGRFRWR